MLRKSPEGRLFSSVILHSTGISAFAGLLLVLGGTAQPCPPMCLFCSADRAECEQVSSLQAVLIGLPNFTEKIVLRRGNLSEIPPLSFQKFPNLRFLSITGFPVSSLTDLTFSPVHANSLRNLDLSNNHLLSCSIQPMAFSGLVTLEELTLDNNSLDILQSPWFLGLTALNKLSLALNRISYLPPRMFENLARLEELVISSNEIQYLSVDTFYGLASLTRLDLSKNKILFINNQVFLPLQTLRRLQLSDNRLTALPTLPSSLSVLFLHENPWDCSCQLVDSVELWMDRIQESARVVCNTPPNLAGRQVTSARLEGCSSASNPTLPPQPILNLSLLYGFLGGVFVGFMVSLLLCCCLKLCKCPSVMSQTESERSFLSKFTSLFSEKPTAPPADPQILGSFPVIENTMIGFEVGNLVKGPCNHLCETSRTYNVGQTKPIVERPLVALLSVDKATNKTVVTLCEKGSETAGSNLNQSLQQTRGEWIHSPNQTPRFLGGTGQQCLAHGEHTSCASPFQHATSNQVERTEYVFPVEGWCGDTQLDGQTLKFDASQPPEALIHEDLPAGNAEKIQRDGAVDCATSTQRNELSGGGCHLNASHSQSEMERKMSSPANGCPPDFAFPSCGETSETRCWQEEGFMERRHHTVRARSGESSQKAGIDSKAYRLRLSKSSRKLFRNLRCIPSYEVTPASYLSSSSSSYSVAPRPRKCTRFPQHLSVTRQTRKMSPEHKKPRRQQTGLNFALAKDASTVEKLWKCEACGCEASHPYSVAHRGLAQLADAPLASKGLLDVASQPLSSGTAPLKDHEIAQSLLVSHQNAENLLAEDVSESSLLPNPPPPLGISHSDPNEDEEEPIYEYSQLFAKSSPGTELSQQAPDMDFPVAEKMVTQVILKEEGGVGMVHTMATVGSTIVHSIKSTNVRSLGEDMYNAQVQVQVEALARAFEQCLADQEKAQVNISSAVKQVSAGQVDRSSSETSSSGAEEPKLREATNVTSSYPLVERMFQIDFPLADEE